MGKRVNYFIIIVIMALAVFSVITFALDTSKQHPSQQDELVNQFVIGVVFIAVGILFLFMREFVVYKIKKKKQG